MMNNRHVAIALLTLIVLSFSLLGYGIRTAQQGAKDAKVASVQAKQAAVAAQKASHLALNAGRDARRGLCALRGTWAQQRRQTKTYLKQHPDGAPSLGISSGQIKQTIKHLGTLVHKLRDVPCSR